MNREKQTKEEIICFKIDRIRIQPENEIKLLGVTIDFELKFCPYISNICKKPRSSCTFLEG